MGSTELSDGERPWLLIESQNQRQRDIAYAWEEFRAKLIVEMMTCVESKCVRCDGMGTVTGTLSGQSIQCGFCAKSSNNPCVPIRFW